MSFELAQFHPLNDRVVIEPVEPDQRHCLIYLPESRKRDPLVPTEGIVRACGAGESSRHGGESFRFDMMANRYRIPLTVHVGTRILYWPTAGRMVPFEINRKWTDCHVLYEEQNIEMVLGAHFDVRVDLFVPGVVLGDRVLVQPKEAPSRAGLIHIPDSAREKTQEGYVIGVGPGARDWKGRRLPIPVEVGNRVLFTKDAGCAFHAKDHVTDRFYMSVREHEIQAVLG